MYYIDSPFTTILEDTHNAEEICQKLKDRFGKHFFVDSSQRDFSRVDDIRVKGQFKSTEAKEFRTFARQVQQEVLQPA